MKQFRPACLALASFACAVSAHAQVKTDNQWRGTGGLAAAYTSGNSDTSSLALTGDLTKATLADKISFGANYNYARSKAEGVRTTTADKWSLLGQYDYNLGQRTYAFGKLGFEGDKVIDLTLRSTVGAGVGYKVIDTDTTSFNVFTGVGYSRDKYDTVQTINDRTSQNFSRASLLFGEESSHKLSDTTSFKQRLEYSPGFTGDKAQIAKLTAGLSVSMTQALALTVGLVDTYNSKPGIGRKQNDVSVLTGISYKLGAN
ncbi:MAG: DUF481 domain-containing protein [Pseudomonadota bacterium]|nr:DUF481 domain-containing protein [Pseudomonadota bacterium]